MNTGDVVHVLSRYDGQGRFVRDGYEGEYFVIRAYKDDFGLSREKDGDADVWVHRSRILETTQYTDFPEMRT